MPDDLFEPVPVIPNITQQLIDDAVKNNPTYDRGFVWHAIRQKFRDEVNERWKQIKPFCEADFVAEFRNGQKFNSRLWELNLRYLFLKHLQRVPGRGEPDLIASNFVVECVVPDSPYVPDVIFDGQLYSYPTDEIGRRVTTALVTKLEQYQRRVANPAPSIDYAKVPYIIAVGLPQREFRDAKSMSGMDIVETVLIGAGPVQITFDSARNTAKAGVSSRSMMQTRNGSSYDIAYFQRDEWKGISAVMWSAEWVPGASDVKILLNPNADVPLDIASLSPSPTIITYKRTNTGYTREQPLREL